MVLPNLVYCISELERISLGGTVIRDSDAEVQPSMYSKQLAGIMKNILRKIEVHDLWLVGSFLHPFFRAFSF